MSGSRSTTTCGPCSRRWGYRAPRSPHPRLRDARAEAEAVLAGQYRRDPGADGLVAEDGRGHQRPGSGSSPCTTWTRRGALGRRAARGPDHPASNKLYQRDPDGFDVEINAYSTEGTLGHGHRQVLQRKAKVGIEQFREGGIDAMDEDGGDSDQYAEFMASSTGNPVFRYNSRPSAPRPMRNRSMVGGRSPRQTPPASSNSTLGASGR